MVYEDQICFYGFTWKRFEKSLEGLLYFLFLPPSSRMSADQSQAIIPCSWSDSHQGISLVWKFEGVLVSAALGPSLAGQHFSSLQLELGQRKNKLSLWAVPTNSLLLSTANHDFMFNYLHYIISPVLDVVHGWWCKAYPRFGHSTDFLVGWMCKSVWSAQGGEAGKTSPTFPTFSLGTVRYLTC